MVTKEEAKEKLIQLIEKHQRHKNEGRLKGISEETTKQWIDDLFRILGWDLLDDITKEYGTGKRKRVDYAFHVDRTIKFLLEAKAYGEELDDKCVKQAIQYGYQNNKTWVVLTNFREIRVYNAKYYDKEEHVRRLYEPIKLEDLVLRFDDLWVLSKEGMRTNLISQLATKYGKDKPRKSIDTLIFEDLMKWRKLLEKAIKSHERLNNIPSDPVEAEKYVDEAVQKLLDRIIFIRVCEDRGLDEEESLKHCIRHWKENKKNSLMENLAKLFAKKNEDYNSGLFAPHYCETLSIDNDILGQIIEESYGDPDGLIYDFSAIDADILGTIYENYLAYIQKKVRDKEGKQKSKRKAQGIYYTPTYIVDYIVKNTLGEKLKECKTPEDALKIKVLDPACGSGSFLIRAYDEFRHWYSTYLKTNGKGEQTKFDDNADTGWQTFMDKVLENCIYGVDLDEKAVELTQLNLLLRAAERKHKLPKLNNTIQCGNSLIDDPIVAGNKAFKWDERFSEVFKNGGFDVVIGNPPYFKIFENDPINKTIDYQEIKSGMMNASAVFINKALKLLKRNGSLSMIVPKMLVFTDSWDKIRNKILKDCLLLKVVDCGKAFKEVLLEQIVFVLQKDPENIEKNTVKIGELNDQLIIENAEIPQKLCLEENSIYIEPNPYAYKIKETMEKSQIILGDISNITLGLGIQGSDFFYDTYTKGYEKVLRGDDVQRYFIRGCKYYDPRNKEIQKIKQTIDKFRTPHIVAQRIVAHIKDHIKITAAFDEFGLFSFNTVTNIFVTDKKHPVKYVLALLNSKPVQYYTYKFVYSNAIRSMDFYKAYAKKIPLPSYVDKKAIEIVGLVDKISNLTKQIYELKDKNTNEVQRLKTERDKIADEIDRLVYELYGLTEEEIKIVEESLKELKNKKEKI